MILIQGKNSKLHKKAGLNGMYQLIRNINGHILLCDWPAMIQSCVKRHPYACLAFLSGVVTTLASNSRPETLRNSQSVLRVSFVQTFLKSVSTLLHLCSRRSCCQIQNIG